MLLTIPAALKPPLAALAEQADKIGATLLVTADGIQLDVPDHIWMSRFVQPATRLARLPCKPVTLKEPEELQEVLAA